MEKAMPSLLDTRSRVSRAEVHFSRGEVPTTCVSPLTEFIRGIDQPEGLLKVLREKSSVINGYDATEAEKFLLEWLEKYYGVKKASLVFQASNGNLVLIELGDKQDPSDT